MKKLSNQIKNNNPEAQRWEADIVLTELVAVLNGGPLRMSLVKDELKPEHVEQVKALLDPIISARRNKQPTIGHEERLAEAVMLLPIRYLPQRMVESRKLTDRWEEWPVAEGIRFPDVVLLYFARRLLVLNQLYRLRRCRLEGCEKYFAYMPSVKKGPLPDFCSAQHRTDYHNPLAARQGRLATFFLRLAKSAAKRDYDLSQGEKKRIGRLGEDTFLKMRKKLTRLAERDTLSAATVDDLLNDVPKKDRERLAQARPYEKQKEQTKQKRAQPVRGKKHGRKN